MKVKVRYFARLREITGKSEEEFELKNAERLSELLKLLVDKYGEDLQRVLFRGEKLNPSIQLLVSGIEVSTRYEKVRLRNGDVVAILPPVGGG